MGKDIDLIVNDVNKAHTALRTARFHVNGRGTKRKAWIRLQSGIVKIDLHQEARLVASTHAEETVERIHIGTLGLLLALTLQGLGTASRVAKVDSDLESTLWLAQCLLERGMVWRDDLAQMVTVEQRQNWENRISPAKHGELLGILRQIGRVN